jgi:hypothetical protein
MTRSFQKYRQNGSLRVLMTTSCMHGISAPTPASPVGMREGLDPGLCYHGQAMMGVGLHAAQPREPRQIRKEATVSGPLRVP